MAVGLARLRPWMSMATCRAPCFIGERGYQKINNIPTRPYGLEEGNLVANVGTRGDTGSTDEASADVGHDVAVEVGHDHHVELLVLGDELREGRGWGRLEWWRGAVVARTCIEVLSTIMVSKSTLL